MNYTKFISSLSENFPGRNFFSFFGLGSSRLNNYWLRFIWVPNSLFVRFRNQHSFYFFCGMNPQRHRSKIHLLVCFRLATRSGIHLKATQQNVVTAIKLLLEQFFKNSNKVFHQNVSQSVDKNALALFWQNLRKEIKMDVEAVCLVELLQWSKSIFGFHKNTNLTFSHIFCFE